MAQYLPDGSGCLRLLHEHNAEYVMWGRQAQLERNPLRRLLLQREYERVRVYEAQVVRRFEIVFAVSEPDRRALLELGASPDSVRVLPNLPEADLLERPALSFASSEPAILYYGTLSWQPNIEGLDHFLRSVYPLVKRATPEARFLIAGSGAPRWLQRLALRTNGVEYLGAVAESEPLYRRARVFVEATGSGGGTKLKVLNALARGLPVVCSPQAAEGLDVVSGEQMLIAADAESMAGAIGRLMKNAALWQALSENGRALVRRCYVADVAYSQLDEVLSGAGAKA
jgi:glycosyltransferase involved in cell wall biosynthesis